MSWTFPPTGVAFVTEGGNAGGSSASFDSTTTIFCHVTTPAPRDTTCIVNQAFSGVVDLPFASAVALLADVYDWYTLHFGFTFGDATPGQDVCTGLDPIPCTRSDSYIASSSGGVVEAVTVVDLSTGSSLGLSGNGSLLSGGAVSAWSIPNPGATEPAFINPAPLFPVPDAYGNVGGETFFTRAQASAFTASVSYGGDWAHSAGYVFQCWARGYRGFAPGTDWMNVL